MQREVPLRTPCCTMYFWVTQQLLDGLPAPEVVSTGSSAIALVKSGRAEKRDEHGPRPRFVLVGSEALKRMRFFLCRLYGAPLSA
jgi:hypothetical protein